MELTHEFLDTLCSSPNPDIMLSSQQNTAGEKKEKKVLQQWKRQTDRGEKGRGWQSRMADSTLSDEKETGGG